MPLITPEQLDHADALLAGVIDGRDEIGLADACRAIENADRQARRLPVHGAKPITVSALLRKRGWVKAGLTGTGHDRQPLYRRAA